MKRFVSQVIWFVALAGILLGASSAWALVCTNPHQPAGTAWCDTDMSNYTGDVLCVVEPVEGPPGSTIDEEVVGGGVCVLGKFKTEDALHNLVDFVISYDMLPAPGMTPEEIFDLPGGVFVPPLDSLAGTREFMTTIPLERDGAYDVSIQTTVLGEGGTLQYVGETRRILRVGVPHLTVTGARASGTTVTCDPAEPNCLDYQVNELSGDSDGDGICDGPDAIPGLCSAGPDLEDNNGAEGPPHTVQVTPPAVRGRSMKICVNSHDGETSAGTSILATAVNTVTDSSVSPSKEIIVEKSCAGEGETVCQASTDEFCPGGFEIDVPLAHGSNQIEIYVNNLATGYDIGAAERITITPFDVDLRGPALCVRYLNDAGTAIADVDNRVLLDSEATSVLVDVTLGACEADPEVIEDHVSADCDKEDPPACGLSHACFQKNGQLDAGGPRFTSLCPTEIGGKIHYQARFAEPRFPINTITFKVLDNIGNETKETHSFGYGQVRSLFNNAGQLVLQDAIVPRGLGGWVPKEFVENELKPLILKAVNSEKFKKDLFPKLLDPRQPGDDEIACLKSIENTINCTMDHLASADRVVSIKPFQDGADGFEIGSIEIQDPYFLNNDRLRVQLKIKGMRGRAEMYTLRFIDSDNDEIVDTEDDDADNDGICDRFVGAVGDCTDANHDDVCDEEKGISGSAGKGLNADRKCILDKSVSKGDCPDIDANDEHYWGCSDLDDDNDGVPDERDTPGRLIEDPDFGTYVIPVRFAVKEAALNLDVRFTKDDQNRLHIEMTNAPGRDLVEVIPDHSYPIEFACSKDVSEVYQGGRAGEVGNGQNLWVDTEACHGLENLNELAANMSESAALTKPRKMQGTAKQLKCTFNAIARCSTPKRLEATLDKFEDQKVMATSMELLDNRFHLDLFSPLGSSEVRVDPRGLGFAGGGLLLPAGVSDPNDKAERNATDFMNTLPAELRGTKVGPLSRADDGVDPMDPIISAFEMGSEINLAANEELVNSILSSVSFLVWDLARREGDAHQSLDMTIGKVREDFGMGIPDIGGSACYDKDPAERTSPNDGLVDSNSYKCFPFPLNIQNVLGPNPLNYVDFDGDGVPGTGNDAKTPILIRTALSPLTPPTVRIASVTPIETFDSDGNPSRPAVVIAELEIGLANTVMSLFEEKVQSWSADPIEGTGEIKDWCDSDRFPGVNSTACDAGQKLPIARFSLTGRAFVTLLLSIRDNGIIRAEAGLSSVERGGDAAAGEEMDVDRTRTYLKFTVLENHTIVPDGELADALLAQVDLMLPKYVFGNARDIRLNIPTQVPLRAFCERYRDDMPDLCECVDNPDGEDCEDDIGKKLEDAWNDLNLDEFGIEGFTLEQPLLGVTGDDLGPTHYLTVGVGATFDLGE